MKKIKITTGLIGKNETFKVMKLAEVTGLGTLLIGVPGVGKTRIVLDYAKSSYGGDVSKLLKNTYILETDEGTKASEVKGRVDLQKLTTENKFELASPITKAEYVVINEVDKGSSAIRNSLLGIMNEKILFNGDSKVPCNWKLFVATCNSIPEDEKDNPFWDRFIIKSTVNRMNASQMKTYYDSGDKSYSTAMNIPSPTKEELDAISIPVDKLELFYETTKSKLSDRSLSFVPMITKAVALIWNLSIDKALIKTCELMESKISSQQLAKVLVPVEMRKIYDKLELLDGNIDEASARELIKNIEDEVNRNLASGVFTASQVNELSVLMSDKIKDEVEGDDQVFKALANSEELPF